MQSADDGAVPYDDLRESEAIFLSHAHAPIDIIYYAPLVIGDGLTRGVGPGTPADDVVVVAALISWPICR